MIIRLDSPDGADGPGPAALLADYTSLTDVALRRRLETERGLYMAESTKVIARAVEAGHAPRSFLMAERHYQQMRPLIAAAVGCGGADDGGDVPVFLAPEEVLESITGFHLHRGALAAMNRPAPADVGALLASARGSRGARRVAVLEDLVDHTNVGAAFRSAAALGIDAVLVTPRCADPLYRRSVRVSMGAVFQVPWTRIARWPAVDELHDAGFAVAALALGEDSVSLDDFASSPACTAAGCPGAPWPRPMRSCASPWPGEWTPSTWPPRPRSPSGRCASATDGRGPPAGLPPGCRHGKDGEEPVR